MYKLARTHVSIDTVIRQDITINMAATTDAVDEG
jgi:hypothetical protein